MNRKPNTKTHLSERRYGRIRRGVGIRGLVVAPPIAMPGHDDHPDNIARAVTGHRRECLPLVLASDRGQVRELADKMTRD